MAAYPAARGKPARPGKQTGMCITQATVCVAVMGTALCLWTCRVDCPFAKVPADMLVKHESLIFAVLEALQLVQPLQEAVNRWVRMLGACCRTPQADTLVSVCATLQHFHSNPHALSCCDVSDAVGSRQGCKR